MATASDNDLESPLGAIVAPDPVVHHGAAIVIADRGWVWVGDVTADADRLTITGARCIRRWGTTEGLGQLVTGPTAETRLDAAVPRLQVPLRAVIAILSVEASAWSIA